MSSMQAIISQLDEITNALPSDAVLQSLMKLTKEMRGLMKLNVRDTRKWESIYRQLGTDDAENRLSDLRFDRIFLLASIDTAVKHRQKLCSELTKM